MPSKRSPEFDKRCISLYLEGQKTIDICRSMGIADRTLYKILEHHGIQKRRTMPAEPKRLRDREKALMVRRDYLESRLSIIRPSMKYERERTLALLEVTNDKLKEIRKTKDPLPNEVSSGSPDLRLSDVDRMVGDIPWSYGQS